MPLGETNVKPRSSRTGRADRFRWGRGPAAGRPWRPDRDEQRGSDTQKSVTATHGAYALHVTEVVGARRRCWNHSRHPKSQPPRIQLMAAARR
jgi:hypothetical protein